MAAVTGQIAAVLDRVDGRERVDDIEAVWA